MSKAFTKETDTEVEDDEADAPSPLPAGTKNYMTPRGFQAMRDELRQLRRVDDLGDFQALQQKSDAAVDLAQPLLAVQVVAVLRAVAVAGGPRHHLGRAEELADERIVAEAQVPLPNPGGDQPGGAR